MKYALEHSQYPELTTFDSEGNSLRFREGILETDDPDVARSLAKQDDIKLVRGKLPKAQAASQDSE